MPDTPRSETPLCCSFSWSSSNCSWRDYYASVAIAERIVLARKVQQRRPVETGKNRRPLVVAFRDESAAQQLGNGAAGVLTFFGYDQAYWRAPERPRLEF